jgi:hypothetical protein
MGTGGKARQRRDADHSPPSSAEAENEYELYLLSPQAPSTRVVSLALNILHIILCRGVNYLPKLHKYEKLKHIWYLQMKILFYFLTERNVHT